MTEEEQRKLELKDQRIMGLEAQVKGLEMKLGWLEDYTSALEMWQEKVMSKMGEDK